MKTKISTAPVVQGAPQPERQTHGGRPVLSLPGFRRADRTPQSGSVAREPVSKPETLARAQAQPPRVLTETEHATYMAHLSRALGASGEGLPAVFEGLSPRPLAKGIHTALAAGYPDADTEALSAWLAAWTNTPPYLHRVSMGGLRYGLDGRGAGEVAPADRRHARQEALKQ